MSRSLCANASRSLMTSLIVVLGLTRLAVGQEPEIKINYDESKVSAYTLPDPLVFSNGEKVSSAEAWQAKRRLEVLRLFETQVYGKSPGRPHGLSFDVHRTVPDAVGGKATRKEVTVSFSGKPDGPKMELLVYIPNQGKRRFPAFLGLNFDGNHGVESDPRIPLSKNWFRNDPKNGYVENRATEKSRGLESSRWPLARIMERGYALATAYYGDIDPDYDDGFKNGVHPLFYSPGQDRPGPNEWG